MVQFWLDKLSDLFSPDNFSFKKNDPDRTIKILNIVALISIIVGLFLSLRFKKPFYFGLSVIALSVTILFKNTSSFKKVTVNSGFTTNVRLLKPASAGTNKLYVNHTYNLNKNDIIRIESLEEDIFETHVIADIKTTTQDDMPVIFLLNDLESNISKRCDILKISGTTPTIISPPDGNISHFGNVQEPEPINRPIKRQSTINNPMANTLLNDNNYNYYGYENDHELMTRNVEATVSQRVDDLLFHRGNSQAQWTPNPNNFVPNNQEAFANFCYRDPTNFVNAKYASVFVNDPEKFKLVSSLARANGTENGGGGGGSGNASH
jgi:hypothetical protein